MSETEPRGIRSVHLPRIDIEKTVANDVWVMLDTLVPTKPLAQLIRNRQTLLPDRQAEIRLIHQVLSRGTNQLADSESQGSSEIAADDREQLRSNSVTWLLNSGSLLR